MISGAESVILNGCREVGNGAYGKVFVGYDGDSSRQENKRAVKRRYITIDSRVSPGCIHVNEIDSLCNFNHPRILHAVHLQRKNPIPDRFSTSNVDTFGQRDGRKYKADLIYVLTEAANCDLQSRKMYDTTFGPSNIDNIREYMWQILDGVLYLHTMGFIHKDLKPSNILDFSNDGKIDIKICDFDMCTPDLPDYIWKKAMTVEYCAPEILKQFHDTTYSKKVDVWSAGLILYYMIKGTTIFRRNKLDGQQLDEYAIAIQELYMPGGDKDHIIDDSIASVKLVPPDLDLGHDDIQDLFNHMCEVNEEKRWDIKQCMQHKFFQGRQVPEYQPSNDHVLEKPHFTEEMLNIFDEKIDEIMNENDAYVFFLGLDILSRVCIKPNKTNHKNLAICCYNIALKFFQKEDANCIALDDENVKTIEYRIIAEKLEGKIYRNTVYSKIGGDHKQIYKYLANDKIYPRKLSEVVDAISEMRKKT